MKEKYIKIENIHKFYKNKYGLGLFFGNNLKKNVVLEDLNNVIYQGDIVFIDGKNGAGKTTLLKIILGLIVPDSGKIHLIGYKKNNIALASASDRSFFWRLSVEENLNFFASIYGLSKKFAVTEIDKWLKFFDLDKLRNSPYMTLSKGEEKKLALARLALKNPQIALFDEPFNSIDKDSVQKVIDLIKYFNNKDEDNICIITGHNINENFPFKYKNLSLTNKKLVDSNI